MKRQPFRGTISRKLQPKILTVDPVLSLYGKTQLFSATRQEQLAYKIDTAMWIQQHIIDLGDSIVHIKRIELLFIFLEAAIAIVFNTYNLSTFVVRFLLKGPSELSILMAITYYGYHIFCAAYDTLITILVFSQTFDKISSTARIANQLGIYVTDESLRLRLFQFSQLTTINLRQYTVFGLYALNGSFINAVVSGTVTYIIILLQYGEESELFLGTSNNTMHTL